jgi:glycerol uptake facilitator-like aquaporin
VSTTIFTRRLFAEFLGTALLVTTVVGSGVMATRLSPGDIGLQLLENSVATMLALAVLIALFGPVSGAHFNPVVSIADWFLGRASRTGLAARDLPGYVLAQCAGGISGSVLANLMFDLSSVSWSQHERTGTALWLGEVVATAGLVLVIFGLGRAGRGSVIPLAVGAYIGAAYWFTSSTSFANPAVTLGRAFSDTFAGISPSSLPGFVIAQFIGLVVGLAALAALYPIASSKSGPVPQRSTVDARASSRTRA